MLFDVTGQFLNTWMMYVIWSQNLAQKSRVAWRGETFTAHKSYNTEDLEWFACFTYERVFKKHKILPSL